MLRFAINIAILTESVKELMAVLEKLEDALRFIQNMKINKDKTMVFVEMNLEGRHLGNVDEITYLLDKITSDRRS